VVTIPGRGASVPSSAELIERLRPISGFEEEYIAANAATANTAALCNELLARCLVPPGSDPGPRRGEVAALLVPERDLALVALRRQSFGDRVESEATCPSCGVVNDLHFTLSDLPIGATIPPREIVVDSHSTTAVVRVPTAADQEALLRSQGATTTAAERRTALVARLIERIDGRDGPLSDEEARALPSAVRIAIVQAIEAVLPPVDLSMDVECSACGVGFVVPFELQAFFLPS
jgi:base plate protein